MPAAAGLAGLLIVFLVLTPLAGASTYEVWMDGLYDADFDSDLLAAISLQSVIESAPLSSHGSVDARSPTGFNARGSTGSRARPTCALDVAPTSPSRFETTCGRASSWRRWVRAPEMGSHAALTSSRCRCRPSRCRRAPWPRWPGSRS